MKSSPVIPSGSTARLSLRAGTSEESRFGTSSGSVALALLVLGGTGFSATVRAAGAPHAVVNTVRLNVRQGPGTNYPVIDVLEAGDDLAITGKNTAESWYQVSLSDGRTVGSAAAW